MAGYSGTPLPRKLGIGPESAVLLDGAPDGFTIGDLPPGVRLSRRTGPGPYDVIVCFCPDRARLARRWPVLHARTTPAGALWIAWPKRWTLLHERVTPAGRLWVCWPKRASGLATDLDENVVRQHGLSHGRVDVKVCAVDDTWSGLKHVVRSRDRAQWTESAPG